MFNFLKNCQTISHSGCTTSYSYQQRMMVLFSLYPHSTLIFCCCGLIGMKWYLSMALICISLMTDDTEHLYMDYWLFLYLLWRNVHSNPLPILKIGLSFYYWVVWLLYIFWILVPYLKYDLQIFSTTQWIFILDSVLTSKVLLLMNFNRCIFFLWSVVLPVGNC